MPFNVNSNAVDAKNNVQTKRGIFRSRAQPPPPAQPVRSKLSSNVPMKANRNKIQSKVLNRKDPSTEPDLKVRRSSTFTTDEIASNVVDKPFIQLVQDSSISNVSQTLQASEVVQTMIKDSCEQSQCMVVNSVHSLVFRMENCKLEQRTTVSNSKTLLTKTSCNELEMNSFPLVTHPHQTSDNKFQVDPFQTSHSNDGTETVPQVGCEKSFRNEKLHANKLSSKKLESCIKNDSPLNKSSNPVAMPVHVNTNNSILNDLKTTSASVDQLKIGDNIKLAMETSNADLFATELKAYQESLKKYDQEAKEVIHKFTESLDEKGKIIRKYEEDFSLFNSRVVSLQNQLEESLERTKKLESTIESKTTVSCQSTITTDEIKSENLKLKEIIKNLETKLAKRDLHIFNLKEVLSIETNKMKELNKAQEEINRLQCESINKSREITILRDELKYAANMRTELVSEYDEKIVKLKKLLAIREYLLMKGKS